MLSAAFDVGDFHNDSIVSSNMQLQSRWALRHQHDHNMIPLRLTVLEDFMSLNFVKS